jgi:hypothetical protein
MTKTTKRHVSMPSIEQFRNVIANINRQFNFVGLDENGEAIYNYTKIKPTLTFKGTVKLHGTNAAVCYNSEGGLWAQSKENVITPEADNMGFAFFVHSIEAEFRKLIGAIVATTGIDIKDNIISIFGEWAGGSIQKTVALNNLPKSFFIFGVKISPIVDKNDEAAIKANPAYWVDHTYLRSPEQRIFNISDYPTWEMDINFNEPEMVQNKLSDLTLAVEEECPVGKAFGFSGIGEGIVWACEFKGVVHRFKVKGIKHSASKVKTLAAVDVEKITGIKEFVEYAVTESRFNQALEKVFLNGEPVDIKKLGNIIKWVIDDVIKEEMDTMVKNNLEPKDIGKYISTKVREMFFKLPV